MRRKTVFLTFIAIVLVITLMMVNYSMQKTTLSDLLEKNYFDIDKIEFFEVYQSRYNWRTNTSSNIDIKDKQMAVKYFNSISNVQFRVNKSVLKESKELWDYENFISMISMKFSYENKQLFITLYNSEEGFSHVIINSNGEINKYVLYYESFDQFTDF